MMRDEFMRLTGHELGVLMPGAADSRGDVAVQPQHAARTALEEVIAHGLGDRPTYVLFSGGRDSSGLLALVTSVARRLGAADPIPVTSRHPHAPRSDETVWQELVVSHLGLREHIVFEFDGEQSLLAPDAQNSLREHGLLWPPDAHVQTAYYTRLEPGLVIAGQGGDLVLSGRRITPLASALTGRHPRRALRSTPSTFFPRRRASVRRMVTDEAKTIAPWLTQDGQERIIQLLSEGRSEPLSWNRGVRGLMRPRSVQLGVQNLPAMARAHGHAALMPYEDEMFLAAMAKDGGFWGLGDRTAVMKYLFADLLPEQVLTRSTKAAFNEVRWGEREREFARTWSGEGVDERFIDPERLRDSWLNDELLPMSAAPMHAAWLADNRIRAEAA